MDEINSKTDLSITMLEQKESRKVKRIAFKVKKINHEEVALGQVSDLLGLPQRDEKLKDQIFQILGETSMSTALWSNHSDDRLGAALKFYRETISSNNHAIKNPVAFFKKAVEEGWYSADDAPFRAQTLFSEEMLSDIDISFVKPNETDSIADLRKLVCDDFGYGIYKAWFDDAHISIEADTCIITHPNPYAQTYILQKLYQPLLNHIKMVVPSVSTINVQHKHFHLT
jgi:hypothetical protein